MTNPGAASRLVQALGLMVVLVFATQIVGMFERAQALLQDPAYLPGWDGSGYVRRGIAYFDAWSSGSWRNIWDLVVRPDIRPPVFGLVLGAFMTLRGDTPAAGIEWAQIAWFIGLFLTVCLGARLRVRGGLVAGALAALITAGTYDHLALVFAPMSESTSLLTVIGATLGTLLLLPHGVAGALGIGLLMLLASMVRYNLGPMILFPLLAWHGWEHRDDRKKLLDPKVLLWGLPAVLVFSVWQLAEPRLAEKVETFLVNRSSGLSFWSADFLLFVPRAAVSDFYGWIGYWIMAFAAIGLLPMLRRSPWLGLASSPELRLVQVQTLAGFVALTLHDYKLARNLYTLVPLLVMCAVTPVLPALLPAPGQSRRRQALGALAGIGALVLVEGWWIERYRNGVTTLSEKYHMKGDPGVPQALDFLARSGGDRRRLWITGVNDALSTPLIEIWLRASNVKVQLKAESPPMMPRTRTGIDAAWTDAYSSYVAEEMMVPKIRDNTTFVTIETLPGTRRYRGGQRWTNYQNNYALAFSIQKEVALVEELVLAESGLRLRSWRSPDADSKDDAEVEVAFTPVAPPLWSDNFGGAWRVVPAAGPITLTRVPGKLSLELGARVDSLQLCGPDVPVPSRFWAVFTLTPQELRGRPPILQLRGVVNGGAPNKIEGKPDIHRLGPVRGVETVTLTRRVELAPGSIEVRPCLVLNQSEGRMTLHELAFYADDGPASAAPVVSAVDNDGEGDTPDDAPQPEASEPP